MESCINPYARQKKYQLANLDKFNAWSKAFQKEKYKNSPEYREQIKIKNKAYYLKIKSEKEQLKII